AHATSQDKAKGAHHERLDQHHALELPAPHTPRARDAQFARSLYDARGEGVRDSEQHHKEDDGPEHVYTGEPAPNLGHPVVDHVTRGKNAQRVLVSEVMNDRGAHRSALGAGLSSDPDPIHLIIVPMLAVESAADLR